jgi:hypothetical protein
MSSSNSPTWADPESIDERIEALEYLIKSKGGVPGTMLTRVLPQEGGVIWSLGLGRLNDPKEFFLGATIVEAVSKAEKAFSSRG